MIELNQEQSKILLTAEGPVRVYDPVTQTDYVLVRADVAERTHKEQQDEQAFAVNYFAESMKIVGSYDCDESQGS